MTISTDTASRPPSSVALRAHLIACGSLVPVGVTLRKSWEESTFSRPTLPLRGPANVPARLDLCELPPASAYWVPFGDARDDGPPRRGPRGGRNREAA